jgi:hypothetical protein
LLLLPPLPLLNVCDAISILLLLLKFKGAVARKALLREAVPPTPSGKGMNSSYSINTNLLPFSDCYSALDFVDCARTLVRPLEDARQEDANELDEYCGLWIALSETYI